MDWFLGWVDSHCSITAAPDGTRAALLGSREAFVDRWRATAGELAECTMRLVVGARVPKWANEHSNAVGAELNELRHERHRTAAAEGRQSPGACDLCGGYGQVVVPVRDCVQGGRLVGHRDYFPRRIVTGAVLCDRPGCRKGQELREANSRRDADRRQMEMLEYSRLVGVSPQGLIGMLADEERAALFAARRRPIFGKPGPFDLRAVLARIGGEEEFGGETEAA